MVSLRLTLYCLFATGAYLLIVGALSEFILRRLGLQKSVPEAVLEETGFGWFVLYFIMEFLFLAVIPSVGYSFLYLVLPFTGIRAGIAAALFALTMGAAPLIMGLSVRLRLPAHYLFYLLLIYFIKLVGAMLIIGYLYQL